MSQRFRQRPVLRASCAILSAILPAVTLAQPSAKAGPPLGWHLSPAALASGCRDAIATSRKAVSAATARPLATQTFANTIVPIERALDAMYNQAGSYAFLYQASPDAALRDSSAACSQLVDNYFVEFGADPRIYKAALRAQQEKLATPADRELVIRYVEGGRHGGAGFDSAQRERVTQRLQRINDLSRDFNIALGSDSTRITITAAEAEALSPQFRASLKPEGAGFIVPVNESTIGAFMRSQQSAEARKRFYQAYFNRGGVGNVERLRTAVAMRDTLAHLFGFPSWAAYQLDVKMAKSPERVIEFLTRVDAGLLPKARSEVARLAPLGEKDGIASLAASDLSFYNERLRRTQFAVDAEQVRQYFPVDHVVPAVLGIYQELLGLRFTEVKPADVWAPGVRQFTVHDATTSASLGTVYLDLFPRANKYSHFANFPLRATYRRTDGTRQPPVTAIIGNWPEGAPGKPALLSHGDVLTFFHEFGHAMSAVSDQSPYLTTGALQLRPDFVEALSQMLENWMWEPRVLKRISHHVATGESLPDSLIQRMIALKHFSDGINGTQQAFLAMYDMTLHSSGPTVDPNTMWTKLEGELTALPSVPNAIPVAGFGHLMGGYDAGYYGYLWSRVYAQDLFTRFEKDGVMNATVGRAYRDLILAPSATEEPDVLLKRFLGRTLSYDAFFRDMGIK